MQIMWPASNTWPDLCEVWPTTAVLPFSCGGGPVEMQVLPEQQVIGLLVEWHIVLVVGMDEKVRRRFVVSLAAADEVEVGGRKVLQTVAVAFERRQAAAIQPRIDRSRVGQRVEQHQFVIPQERQQAALPFELQHLVDHAPAVAAAVDVVPQRDDRVFRLRLNRGDQRAQCVGTAVNVADGNGASGHS